MKNSFISITICLMGLSVFAQTNTKKYINTDGNFSVELPITWSVLNDTKVANRMAICLPTSDKDTKEYATCFDGIIFYIEKYKSNLPTTLQSKGYVVSSDSVFVIDKENKKIQVAKIQKNNYKGIYNQSSCNYNCKNADISNLGKCDYLFFALSGKTICIYTNGRALPDNIRNHIIATFKFI